MLIAVEHIHLNTVLEDDAVLADLNYSNTAVIAVQSAVAIR